MSTNTAAAVITTTGTITMVARHHNPPRTRS
jgi:hypothetical protein